jgi:hypothetical protein
MSVFTHWATITPAACLWHRVGRAFTGAIGSRAMLAIVALWLLVTFHERWIASRGTRVFTRNQDLGAGMDLEQ